jgi:hypothetical protein
MALTRLIPSTVRSNARGTRFWTYGSRARATTPGDARGEVVARRRERLVELRHGRDHRLEGSLQEVDAVPDVLHGGVDLVGDPRGELADGLELLRQAEIRLHALAVADLLLEPRVGLGELEGAQPHGGLELLSRAGAGAVQGPLAGEGVGDLDDLDGIERLLEDQQVLGVLTEPRDDLGPRVIGVRRADDDLQLRGLLPHALDRLEAVPAGRHVHVDERQRVRPAVGHGGLDERQRVLPLHRRRHGEAAPRLVLDGIAEDGSLHARQLVVAHPRRRQDARKIAVDRWVVIDHQDAPLALTIDLHHHHPALNCTDLRIGLRVPHLNRPWVHGGGQAGDAQDLRLGCPRQRRGCVQLVGCVRRHRRRTPC